MSGRPFSAGRLLWPALALGVAGNFLFRADHLGLNVVVWVGGVALCWYSVARRPVLDGSAARRLGDSHSAARRLGDSAAADPLDSPDFGKAETPGAESPAAESPAAESPAAESPAAESSAAEPPSRRWEHGLLLCALALAAAWVWRDNPMLRFLDGLALVVVAALLPLARGSEGDPALAQLTVARALRALVGLAARGATGLLPVVLDAQRETHDTGNRRIIPVAALVRGLVIAVPTGVVFGGLLASADPVFGDAISRLISVDPEILVSHALGITVAAWIASAALRGALPHASSLPDRLFARPASVGLGAIEIAMTLGVANALFAGFIAFQLPYFFGGAGWVERTAGVTLAEYARRGFFELVVVTTLVLPLLLGLNAQLAPENARARRIYRWLAGTQLVLVFAIIASGMHRMALYQGEFGLTEDRLFASALMAGTAVTCGWFAATVLQGRPLLFARGALFAWGAWLALLNVVNPDQVIVNTNLRRFAEGKTLDASYLTRLSTDAVPALVAALPALPDPEGTIVRNGLLQRHDIYSSDVRDWHYGRNKARRAILTLYEATFP
jgi:hypothetical protein